MDLIAYDLQPVEVTDTIAEALGAKPLEGSMGRDPLCIMDNETIIGDLSPDMNKLLSLDGLLLHVTAFGKEYDSVSRTFASKLNVTEEPVCGSGHCHIIPFWKIFRNGSVSRHSLTPDVDPGLEI